MYGVLLHGRQAKRRVAMAIEEKLNQSLDERCRKLKRDFVDFFILHGYIIPVDWQNSLRPKVLPFQPINTP